MAASSTRSATTTTSGPICLLVLATLVALTGAPALARQSGSGYESDYDYTGQGDDWYGRGNRPSPKRDFAPTLLDQLLSGEDFCQGYERAFDPWGLGAPLFRTSDRQSDYAFRFTSAGGSWPCIMGVPVPSCDDGNPCTFDALDALFVCVHTPETDGFSCSDLIFCNGAETCLTAACTPGIAPSCDDANSCTMDACEAMSDQCVNTPLAPPGEALNLAITPDEPGGRFATLSWDRVPGADLYDVYRSTSGLHTELVCFQRDLRDTRTSDLGESPLDGELFLFLPVSVNCASGGTLGYSSDGRERRARQPCR